MMGVGKSTVGELLARGLGSYTFLDLDTVVEQAAGSSCKDLFARDGEEKFREIESAVLNEVKNNVRCVVGTGGGVVTVNQNWRMMQTGIVVWLDAPADVIVGRLGKEGIEKRPLLVGANPAQKIEEILETRRKSYEQSDVRIEINADDSQQSVVEKIIDGVHTLIDENPPEYEKNKKKAKAEGMDWV